MAFKFDTKNALKQKPKKVVGGNIEQDCKEELSELTTEFSKAAQKEKDTFKDNVDANYFAVITFNNSRQLQEFYNKLGITPSDPQYIDGKAFAKKLGIEITEPDKKAPGAFRINKKLVDLSDIS